MINFKFIKIYLLNKNSFKKTENFNENLKNWKIIVNYFLIYN